MTASTNALEAGTRVSARSRREYTVALDDCRALICVVCVPVVVCSAPMLVPALRTAVTSVLDDGARASARATRASNDELDTCRAAVSVCNPLVWPCCVPMLEPAAGTAVTSALEDGARASARATRASNDELDACRAAI